MAKLSAQPGAAMQYSSTWHLLTYQAVHASGQSQRLNSACYGVCLCPEDGLLSFQTLRTAYVAPPLCTLGADPPVTPPSSASQKKQTSPVAPAALWEGHPPEGASAGPAASSPAVQADLLTEICWQWPDWCRPVSALRMPAGKCSRPAKLVRGPDRLPACLQKGGECTWLTMMCLQQPVPALHCTLKSLDPCSGPRLSAGRVPPPVPLCLQDMIVA